MNSPRTIFLEVTHPEGEIAPIEGFRFIWAFYVSGYDPKKHCQPAFKGTRAPDFCTGRAMSGRRIALDRMDRYDYVYVCGVGVGPKSEKRHQNLHLPLRYESGTVVEHTTYNGYRFRLENAALVTVPPLPDDFAGLPREHARCKNFQFAVAVFGYPPTAKPA